MSCTQVLTAEIGDLVELRLVGAESAFGDSKLKLEKRWMWTYHTGTSLWSKKFPDKIEFEK